MGRPYTVEEIITFDRIKRAIAGRVVEAAEPSLNEGMPLTADKLKELATLEWKAAKEAIWASPLAKEKAKEYMRKVVSGLLDTQINADRAELEALGVKEKYI
ncbi:MAG: hypothetical protein Q7T05_03635 [Dehalococcoidia bacterium]|nr:hypothetical protein [Dehalococcoidia bacterium]